MAVFDIFTLVQKKKKSVLSALTPGLIGCMVFHLLSLSAKRAYLMPFYNTLGEFLKGYL